MKDLSDIKITRHQFARMIGLSVRRIDYLIREQKVTRVGTLIPLEKGILEYCESLRKTAKVTTELRINHLEKLAEHKARLTEEQADLAKIKNQQLRGELLDSEKVEKTWSNILRGIQMRMLAYPNKVQQRLTSLTRHDVAEMDRMMREELEDASKDES